MPTLVKCPLCRKEIPWENNPFRPFCSERCRTRDLGNWASGRYAIPAEESHPSSESAAGPQEEGEGKGPL